MTLALPEKEMLSLSSSLAAQPRDAGKSVSCNRPFEPASVPGPLRGLHGGFAVVALTTPVRTLLPISVPVPAPRGTAVTCCPLTFAVTLPLYFATRALLPPKAVPATTAARARPAAIAADARSRFMWDSFQL